jgi:hypothetical protein
MLSDVEQAAFVLRLPRRFWLVQVIESGTELFLVVDADHPANSRLVTEVETFSLLAGTSKIVTTGERVMFVRGGDSGSSGVYYEKGKCV